MRAEEGVGGRQAIQVRRFVLQPADIWTVAPGARRKRRRPIACRVGGRAGAGGVMSFFAAGCPVCNKLVVLAIGTTGAVDYFRPLQPMLGAASIVLLAIALRARWQTRPRFVTVPLA